MYHDSVKLESVCGLFVGSRAFSRQRPRSGRTRERREIERERVCRESCEEEGRWRRDEGV